MLPQPARLLHLQACSGVLEAQLSSSAAQPGWLCCPSSSSAVGGASIRLVSRRKPGVLKNLLGDAALTFDLVKVSGSKPSWTGKAQGFLAAPLFLQTLRPLFLLVP